MKAGDTIRLRPKTGGDWCAATVILASGNEDSIAVAGEDLPSIRGGYFIHPRHGKVLSLVRNKGKADYKEIFTGTKFEVEDCRAGEKSLCGE